MSGRLTDGNRGTKRPEWGRWAALVLALSLVLTGCAGDDDTPEEDTSPAEGTDETDGDDTDAEPDDSEAQAGGTLRYGTDLTATGGDRALDPPASRSVGDLQILRLIYDTLIHVEPDGSYSPGLAESWEVQGDNAITLTLREGVTFHDGAPLTAEAVKSSIERNIAAENRNFAPTINNIESIETPDERTITITLGAPVIGSFFELLAGRETMVVSPQADPEGLQANPVGAGPYQFDSFESENQLSLDKYGDHYAAEEWNLDRIEFVHVPSGPQRINAIRSGTVDMVELDEGQPAELEGDFETLTVPSDADFFYMATCKSQPPFDDVRVRQAFNYGINRQEVIDTLQGGSGTPMWMLWPEESAYYTESLEGYYAHDPEKAQQLLEEAGYGDGMDLELAISAGNSVLEQLGEILQAQYSEIGVNVTLRPVQDIVTEFYRNATSPAAPVFWIRPGLQKVTRAFGPDSVANVCDYSDPELLDLTDQIAALAPDDPQVKELWDQVNQTTVEDALWTYISWRTLNYAWDPETVSGIEDVYSQIQGPAFQTILVSG